MNGAARRAPRARGRCPRARARSRVAEDCTRTPRGRARSKMVLSRRGRLVSRIGEKKRKSTTCEPSTLRKTIRSCPARKQRSACTSSPRRARTRQWKWAGRVYIVSGEKALVRVNENERRIARGLFMKGSLTDSESDTTVSTLHVHKGNQIQILAHTPHAALLWVGVIR